MKKLLKLKPSNYTVISYIGLAGLSAFFILNIAALVEYTKYTLGVSNYFIILLPAIKLLLNIDFLFVVALILIYNSIDKFLDFKFFLIGAALLGVISVVYALVNNKPMLIIAALGLYGLGIFLYTSILGFTLFIPKSDPKSKVKKDKNHKLA